MGKGRDFGVAAKEHRNHHGDCNHKTPKLCETMRPKLASKACEYSLYQELMKSGRDYLPAEKENAQNGFSLRGSLRKLGLL